MASLHDLTVGQDIEFKRVLASAGMDLEDVEAIIKSPHNILARWLVEWFHEQMGKGDLFVSPDQQVTNFRYWSEHTSHVESYSQADFESVVDAIADLPSPTGLTTPVLVPYRSTISSTYNSLWRVIESVYAGSWRTGWPKSDKRNMRLFGSIEHPGKCLRWEIIDLGAHSKPNSDRTAADVRGIDSAHAGILAAVAHFPTWRAAMAADKVPDVHLAGYECYDSDRCDWCALPSVCRQGPPQGPSAVRLCVAYQNERLYDRSAPVLKTVVS